MAIVPRGGLVQGYFDVAALVPDPNVRATLFDYRWALAFDDSLPATRIPYSFPTSADVYRTPPVGFAELSPVQKEAVRVTFALVSSYTNLTFSEVGAAADATIRIGRWSEGGSQAANPGHHDDGVGDGDVSLGGNAVVPDMNGFVFGTDHFLTIPHELGHALGLKHGHDGSPNGALASNVNGHEFSVMTYASWLGSPPGEVTAAAPGSSPISFMMFDIAALQAFYGANLSKVGTRDVYRWDAITGQQTIDGDPAPATGVTETKRIFSTVWTQGAVATYDLSNYTRDQVDDLRPGRFLKFSDSQLADLNNQAPSPDDPNYHQAQGNIYNALLFKDDLVSAIANLITSSGNDTLIGNDRDNQLTANAGNDTILTNGGNDTVRGGPGADAITFGSGNSILRDTPADLNGDVVSNFGRGAVDVLGERLGVDNLVFTPQQATLSAGTETVVLNGNFTGGEFLFSQRGAGADAHTTVGFVPYLPVLREGVTVDATVINGIASQPFLTGDGMARFTGEFRSAVSAYGSQLGWYKIAADGTIGNVRLLVSDTRDAEAIGRSFDLGTPANDERIGFFLVTNGVWAYGNNLPDDLSFVLPGGQAANVDFWRAPVLMSASLGALTEVPVFHSFDGLNPSAATQVLSGLPGDGRELLIGFEDLPYSRGDRDYQDVVIAVHFTPEDNRIV